MKAIIALLITLGLCGCASVEIKPVEDAKSEGMRFFRPEPYLFVGSVEETLTFSVIWLPNTTKEYALRTTGHFGSSELKATLENGWMLTELGAKQDSKIPETIAAIGGLVGAAMIERVGFEPGFYRIDFDTTGHVSGFTKIGLKP